MAAIHRFRFLTATAMVLALGACSPLGNGKTTGGHQPIAEPKRDTIWDLFRPQPNANATIAVNKYLWKASLDVLSFLPIQSIDPFSGVIVMGYGIPPGGRTAYRATVTVSDPALDARSLSVVLQTRDARVVDKATTEKIEDAILTRARQLRIADGQL